MPQGSKSRGPLPAPAAAASLGRRRSAIGMGDEEFGSDWGQFSQPLPLWQDAHAFGGSHEGFGERPRRRPIQDHGHDLDHDRARDAAHALPERRAPQRSLDTTRYNTRSLPVLDDVDDEAMMDDIVGVVVDTPRYAAPRPRRV